MDYRFLIRFESDTVKKSNEKARMERLTDSTVSSMLSSVTMRKADGDILDDEIKIMSRK